MSKTRTNTVSLPGALFKLNSRMEKSKVIGSIHKGFIMVIPVFLIGSLALIFMNFPIAAVRDFLAAAAGGKIYGFLNFVYQATFGVCSFYIALCVAFRYSQRFFENTAFNMLAGVVALASYVAALGLTSLSSVDLIYTNVSSVFSALLCAVLSTRLFIFLLKIILKRKWFGELSADIDFGSVMQAIVPMLLTIGVFALVPILMKLIAGVTNFNDLFLKLASMPFEKMGRSFWSALLIVFLQTLLWFFGIHGSNVFENVIVTLFSDAPGQLITKTFLDSFVLIGGSGSLICLCVSMLIFSRTKRHRILSKSSLPLMLFNINEVMIFGLPIVLNPFMLIPFLLTPIAMLIISYGAVALGIVPLAIGSVHWTTPIFFNGYLATGSVMGIVLQLAVIAVGVGIYTPFVRISERYYLKSQEALVGRLGDAVREAERSGTEPKLFNGDDELSKAAKEMSLQLSAAIDKGRINMFYQPIVDTTGKVVAAEALLRWKYLSGSYVFPPLLLALAKEAGFYPRLSTYIRDTVIADTARLNQVFPAIHISLNVRSEQLDNKAFIDDLIEKIFAAGISSGTLYLEITEEHKLKDNETTREAFLKLAEKNIACAIDDFSMGHTSLKYLQSSNFKYVKLDGTLVADIIDNPRSRNIVKSIVNLGKKLGFAVIGECVETEEQRHLLERLGCVYYQGYLYSPAVAFDELLKIIGERNGEETTAK